MMKCLFQGSSIRAGESPRGHDQGGVVKRMTRAALLLCGFAAACGGSGGDPLSTPPIAAVQITAHTATPSKITISPMDIRCLSYRQISSAIW